MINTCFIPFPKLNTANLVLRPLEMDDSPEIFQLRSDPSVNLYLDRKQAKTEEDALEFIQMIQSYIRNGESIFWAISSKKNDQLLGTICYWNIDHNELKAEIGYELLPKEQGKGIMQEAVKKVIEFGFDKMGLKEIEACLRPENLRSTKLLEKCGFVLQTFVPKPGDDAEANLCSYSLKRKREKP